MQSEIDQCLHYLAAGKTILYPTDTVWGIGCDATNRKAIEEVFRLKKRMEHKSLIILLDDAEKLPTYVEDIPHIAYDLLQHVTSPLTIIYPCARNLPSNLVADDGSIAIRVTNDPFCKQLVHDFGKPVVSTSANISGTATPRIFKNISSLITEKVDYVVNLHQENLQAMKPSRIIRLFNNGEFEVIRP